MNIKIAVKQLGKKRPVITQKSIEIEDLVENPVLEDLIKAVVTQQVDQYNSKEAGENAIPFLTEMNLEEKEMIGKVGFGSIYNKEKADVQKAIETALIAFTDGIYCVFINDDQIEKLDQKIDLDDTDEDKVITFVRLTFLAGSFW